MTGHPTQRQVTATAWLFSLCFVVAQADKQVMGLLAEPVRAAFALSNAQLGFLQGGAFALAYAVGGLPISRLIDSGPRVRIAAICVALWSLATLSTGLAGTFVGLVICRAATAFAEAGLPPAAFSVFAQGKQKDAAKLISAFMLAPFVGGGLVLLLGGGLLKALDGHGTPLPGWSEPWRVVMLAVGAPGLLLAFLLLWFGREPPRDRLNASVPLPSTGSVIRTILFERRFLRYHYVAASCFYALVAALIAWYPAFLSRRFGVSVGIAGAYSGLTFLVGGVAGTLAVNMLARRRSIVSLGVMFRDFKITAAVLLPVVILIPLAPNLTTSVALYAVYAFASAAIISSLPIPIQLGLPDNMRARGTALASLVMSGLAGTLGPLATGLIVDRGVPLAIALSLVSGSACVAAWFLFRMARRHAPTVSGCEEPHC